MFLTDGAKYMLKAGKRNLMCACACSHSRQINTYTSDIYSKPFYPFHTGRLLKLLYPRMIHCTCLAHSIHRISEYVRNEYKAVDKFIALVKKVFLKANSRVKTFRRVCPGLNLPPAPITTRWTTWLKAVHYYSENMDSIIKVFFLNLSYS